MIYYAFGTALLSGDEYEELHQDTRDEIREVATARGARAARKVKLRNGVVDATARGAGDDTTPWEPIGPGKPLTIDIREIYTGKHPGGLLGGSKPMLVTSAVKSIATYDAKPRAVNFLTKKTNRNSRLTRPKASEEGTPVIFHSPAVTERSLTVDIGIVFDNFPQPVFDAVGSAFKSAAGVPIFLAYSTHLLAAGEIARLVGSAGERLFDGKPAFDASEAVNLELPGGKKAIAGHMLITPSNVDSLDPAFRDKYHVTDGGTLVDDKNKQYKGDVPYVILSVDGSTREDLAGFAPTAASAAVLTRFFGIKDGQSVSLDPLMDALRLYNDFTFRSELDRIDKRLKGMKAGDEKTALEEKREAVLKNIMNDLLKPASAE